MNKCGRCEENIVPEEELVCKACSLSYHYTCCNHTGRTFNNLTVEDKAKFKCINCKSNTSKTVKSKELNDGKPKEKPEGTESERRMMDYFDAKFGILEATIAKQKDEVIGALNLKVEQLEKKLAESDDKIMDLEEKMDMLENRSRITNLEIRNMPETQNDDVKYLVKNIGETIGVTNIKEGDIQVAHRVNNRNGSRGNRPIIVHLSSRYMRNVWIQKYKDYKKKENGLNAKKINNNLADAQVFIHEHITVSKKLLLNEVREYAKAKNIMFVWVKDAMILVQKNKNDKLVTKINSKREFEAFKNNPNF